MNWTHLIRPAAPTSKSVFRLPTSRYAVLALGLWAAAVPTLAQDAAPSEIQRSLEESTGNRQLDLLAARLSFLIPEELSELRPRPPAVFEGAHIEHSVEMQRLIVFVVPCAVDASSEEILSAAEIIAATFIGFRLPVKPEDLEARPFVATGEASFWKATLAIARLDHRHLGFLAFGPSDVDALDEAPAIAAASLSTPAAEFPATEMQTHRTPGHGFSIDTPSAFEHEDPEWPILLWAHPPMAHGIPGEISIRLTEDDLEFPLEIAAERLHDRLNDQDGMTASSPSPISTDGISALAVQFELNDDVGIIGLIDLPRHRAELTIWTNRGYYPAFERAFQQTLQTLRSIEQGPDVAFHEDTYNDSEEGFSLRAPRGFVRVAGTGALASFVEITARPPASAIHVERLDLPSISTMEEAQSAAESRIHEQVARGYEAVGKRSLRIEKGRPAISFTLSFVDPDTKTKMIDSRTLIAGYGRTFEFSFVGPAASRKRDQRLEEATRVTFRTSPPKSAPALAAEVITETARLRPPDGWAATGEHFEYSESDALDGAHLRIGTLTPEDAGPLAGPGEVVRTAIVTELERVGATVIRIRNADRIGIASPPETTLSLAYNLNGQPFRELCRVLEVGGQLIYARAYAPADRYAGLEELLTATLDSLGAPVNDETTESDAAGDEDAQP